MKAKNIFIILSILLLVVDVYYRIVMVFHNLPEYSWTMEANVISSFLRFTDGIPLYSDMYQAPFAIVQYGPVWYLLEYIPFQIFSLFEKDQVLSAYFSGRILSILFVVSSILLTVKIAKKLFKINGYAAFCISLIGYSLIVTSHFFVSRPDSASLFIGLLGVYCFTSQKKYSIYLTAIIVTFAILTKQNQLFLAIGFVVYFILNKNYKDLLKFSVTGIITGIIMLGILYALYGYNIILNLTDGLANGSGKGILNDRYIFIIGIFLSVSIWIFTQLLSYKIKSSNMLLIACIALVNIVLSISASFKTGSDMNYFVDFLFYFSILLSGLYSKYENENKDLLPLFYYIPFCLILLSSVNHWRYVAHPKFDTRQEVELANYLKTELNITKEQLIIYDQSIHNLLNNYIARNHFFPQLDVLSQVNYGIPNVYIPLIKAELQTNKSLLLIKEQEGEEYNVIGFIPIKCKLIKKINKYYLYSVVN